MGDRDDVSEGQRSEHHQGQADSADDLAVELGRMARDLQQRTPEDLLEAMVRAAVDLIPGVEDGAISIVLGRKTIMAQAATSDLPSRADTIQMEEREGPCLDAVYEQTTVRVPDMRSEDRWPAFARRADAETGVRSMLSFQLFVEDENLGALNLYSRQPNAFTDESENIGLLVASHAAVAFAESRQEVQFREAIASRDIIGQAKGILMERYKITAQQAFLLLSHASSTTNAKLLAVAEHLVDSGELRTRRG